MNKKQGWGILLHGQHHQKQQKLTNGASLIVSKVLKHAMSSAAEA
jgi:hypothetical protein